MEVFLAAAGGTWFAIFALIILAAGIFSAEFDSFFGGTVTLSIGLLGADLIFGYPIFSALVANPLIAIVIVGLYVMIGSAYTGIWRWPEYLRGKSENIEHDFAQYRMDNKGGSFDDFLESNRYNGYRASSNKERLSAWVLMWPFSLFWELARKPAKWAFNTVYATLGNMFENVGKNTAKKMHERNK